MYRLLSRMPLLQGISGMELAHIEERIDLETEVLPASRKPFIMQGQLCRELVFHIEGNVIRQTHSADGLFVATETVSGPVVVEADKLYGLNCEYSSTYRAASECQLMRISKKQVGDLLAKSDIFRLNYLNLLSAAIQRKEAKCRPSVLTTPAEKITHFILGCFSTEQGEKSLQIKMTDLAAFVSETRLTVSRYLNQLCDEGIVSLKRKEIYIPDITRLC
ncbi:MAG: Crp/Fnr family transcriptional regulator [Bacteroidaceae bacterium]|nr:Crp/Fnr family transcriptional regulator [Bacteroidaceae bacterium]